MSLKKKVISSLSWLILLRYLTRAIDLVKYVFISRLILPSDLGSFLLATTIVLTFEALSDTGFQFAFIQKQKKIEKYAKTLWILGIVRGAVITFLVLCSIPLFIHFFNTPSLFALLLVLSFVPLIKGFQSPYVYLFQRDLEFNKEFFYKILPMLVSSIFSITLAFMLKNSLGLTLAIVLGTIVETAMSFLVTKTRFPYPFSMKIAKELFNYGKHLTMGGIFTLLVTQTDTLFVGRVFGTTTLALYELAFKLANVAFSEITDVISRVAFPLFAKIQKQKALLLKTFKINLIGVTIPAVSISIFFFFFAEQSLTLFFGSAYKEGASILKILSIYGMLRAIVGPTGPLLLAVGKPKVTSQMSIVNFVVLIILLYPLTQAFGLNGVALSMIVSYLCVLPFLGYHVIKSFIYEKP